MKNPFKKLVAVKAAMQAGWIAQSCHDCVIDDEAEEIRACPTHEAKIAELAKKNSENW